MSLLMCKLGFHKWSVRQKWLPSFNAEIVTDVITDFRCKKCGKIKPHYHYKWNPRLGEMEKVKK